MFTGKEKRPVLITGCARSGTSMSAGIMELCGLFGGKTSPPNRNNKKGMFENDVIRNTIVKPYLRQLGVDPLGQNPLPDPFKLETIPHLKDKIHDIFKLQGWDGKRRWYYKGAKMCLMWQVWDHAFMDAQWIIVRRPDEQIIDSCLRTSFMQAYKTKEGWQKWINHHKRMIIHMKNCCDYRELWSDKLIIGNYSELESVLKWLNLRWNPKIVEFITPSLYTNK